MKIVNILRYHRHIKILFEFGKDLVTTIRFYFQCFFSPLIVEIENKVRIFVPALRSCNLHHIETFPQTIRVAESWNATFSTDAGTTQYNDLLTLLHLFMLPHP